MIDYSKYGFINFKVIKENWNAYKLKDNSIILIKFILIKFQLSEVEEGTLEFNLNAKNVIGTLPDIDLCGEPGAKEYIGEELETSIIEEDIEFSPIEESWNEYNLEDGRTLFLKLVLTMASRTNKFDDHGEPIYLTQTQLLTKIK